VEGGLNRLNHRARRFDSFDSARTGRQCWQTRSSKLDSLFVIDDIAIGDQFHMYRNGIRSCPLLLVNLVPSLEVLERRNKERRTKNVFHPWGPILDRAMRETMRDVGMWLDNSSLCVTETVDEILRRAWAEAVLS
jgi:hypothetical protein